MDKFLKCIFLILLSLNAVLCIAKYRSRRFLVFPPTAPTRVQIISGIGIPVDLELESVTIGYVFKAEFFLPENASNYLNGLSDPFELSTQPISGRRRRFLNGDDEATEVPSNAMDGYDSNQHEHFEKHEVKAEIVESGTETTSSDDADYDDERSWFEDDPIIKSKDPLALKEPQNIATTRWTIYKGIAAIADSKGLAGRSCVLRSICESAHTPFDYSNGILGELMHIVMSPSTTHDQITDQMDYEYYRAEQLGKEGAPCDRVFGECKTSILNKFTGIYTPVMNLISRIADKI